MAGVYQVWRWLGGSSAAEHPDDFCRLMTMGFIGTGRMPVAVGCLFVMAMRIGLSQRRSLRADFSFWPGNGVDRVCPARQQSHPSSGRGDAPFLALLQGETTRSLPRTALVGCLVGLAYAIHDLGAGPPLLVLAGVFTLFPRSSVGTHATGTLCVPIN